MVVLVEIGAKQSQEGRRRVNGAIRPVADRSAMEENLAVAPGTAQAPRGWPSVNRQPPCARSDSLDSVERRSLTRSAGEISASFDLLTAAARLV